MSRGVAPWFLYSMVAWLLIGVTNFLLGTITETGAGEGAEITAPILTWCAVGGAGVVAAVGLLRSRGNGRGIGGIRAALASAAAGVTLSAGMMALTLALAADPTGRGPIVAIAGANAVPVAVLSLVVLGERLTRVQTAGFAVVTAGIVIVGISSGIEASLLGVALGVATMFLLGFTNFLLKYAGHHGADAFVATALLWLSSGVVGALAVTVSLISGRGLPGTEVAAMTLAALSAGVTLALGVMLVAIAVTRCPAGPASAIVGANAILVTVLDAAVFASVPSAPKLLGMFVAIAGIVILALGQHGPGHVPEDEEPAAGVPATRRRGPGTGAATDDGESDARREAAAASR